MRNQSLILIGVILIAAGLMFLVGNLLDINIGAFCFPVGLMLIGLFLILRPRMVGPDTRSDVLFIGDWERSGPWEGGNEELWAFVGDINYDLTKATLPKGESKFKMVGFVNDVEIFVPADLGVAIDASSFVTSFNADGQGKEDNILSPVRWETDNYQSAERRVRFELLQFVGEIKVRRF